MTISRSILFAAVFRLVCAAGFWLLAIRMMVSGTGEYAFLLWNLCLAGTPYFFSKMFESAVNKTSVPRWRAGIVFVFWLSFFPNAPYIATDFIHLPWEYSTTVRFAYDFAMVGMFTLAGLLLGMASLFRVHRTLRKLFGRFRADLAIISVLLLSGIGMYLGRFLRWNSWDMFLNPWQVLHDIFAHYGDPVWFGRAVFLSMIFSAFTAISYAIFAGLYRFFGERQK